VREYLEDSRYGAALAWSIGLLGLLLASVGVLGVFAYAVEERRREIGVRLALGAPPRGIVNAVLGQGLRLATTGVVLGSVGAYAASGVLRSILFETNPTDGVMFLVIGTGLIIVAAAASALPARRAARVDPIVTLRSE
jgi:ABC-type antimicrobial peptide transport system permease subunit